MSLDLDARRRAMLAEMGVRVWWPEPALAPQSPLISLYLISPLAALVFSVSEVVISSVSVPVISIRNQLVL